MRDLILDSYDSDADRFWLELYWLLDAAIDLPSGELRPFLERAASTPELALEAEVLLREEAAERLFQSQPRAGLSSYAAMISEINGATPVGEFASI